MTSRFTRQTPHAKALKLLLERFPPGWEAQRIENTTARGVPDIAFSGDGTHGWVEVKAISRIPKLNSTSVRFADLTSEQRCWIHRHHAAGGNVWVCVFIQRESLLLFFPGDLVNQLGRLTYLELLRAATLGVDTSARLKAEAQHEIRRVLSRCPG